MTNQRPLHVSVIGAGSAYGIYIVKWAFQLLKDAKSNREEISLPPIGTISFSNTDKRNVDLVFEVLQDDLHQLPGFENLTMEDIHKHVRAYDRWREMAKTEKADLVVICSPTETHVPIARELITDFGVKNILCESPVTSINDSDSLPGLLSLVEEKGVRFGVNEQYAPLMSQFLKDVPLQPEKSDSLTIGRLTAGLTKAQVTFITHGTRPWRRFGNIGELIILEDLGIHVLHFLPPEIRHQPVKVKKVNREGDNVFLNLVEYDLLFGKTPVRLVLGYRRKLKSLKVVYGRGGGQDYEFHIIGTTNSDTGEYTRGIEGKNYAYPFRFALRTDLVKYSFMRSLADDPLVLLQEAIKNQNTLRQIYEGSVKIK